jgi:hypothetical protein
MVITNPNAVVDGNTIRQWAEIYLTSAFNAPFVPNNNPLDDPNGTAAVAFNSSNDKMYFITEAPAGSTRAFDVPLGKDILLPIAFTEDTEGPGISPSIPNFKGPAAAEVHQVLATSHFSDVTLSVDGKQVSPLIETRTGIFSAGVVQAASVAQAFFGAAAGTSLATTGEEGYFVVLSGLSPGEHTISSTSSFDSKYLGSSSLGTHTDIINVS